MGSEAAERKKESKSGARTQPVAKIVSKLTDTEKELLSHMENGYHLETNSLDGDPVLRNLKDDEVMRPFPRTDTVKALEERGPIVESKSRDPLKIVWRIKRRA